MMKKSIYNIVLPIGDTHYLVFNSRLGLLRLLSTEQYIDYEANRHQELHDLFVDEETDEMQIVRQERESYILGQKDYIRYSILPTLKCNANCAFCFENTLYRKSMSKKDIERTISYIKSEVIKYKKLRIHWFGGEPMVASPIVYKITKDLYDFCLRNNISYRACIGTNLSLINEDNYKSIIEDLHLDSIEFAFDGVGINHNSTKTYNNERFDAYSHNLHMLDLLLNYKINVSVRFNSTKTNYKELLTLIEELCGRYSSYKNFNPYLAVIVSTEQYKNEQILIAPEEYASYYIPFFRVLQKYGAGLEVYPLHRNANFCYGSNPNSIVIGSDGILTKCIASPSAKSQAIGTIWTGVQKNHIYRKWTQENLIEECWKCPIYPLCLGGCINDYLFKSISPCKKEKYYLRELLEDAGKYMLSHGVKEYKYI